MKKCPACKKWTLDFDDYFSRFRCFNSGCGWIQSSPVEREQRLSQHRAKAHVSVSGRLKAIYDEEDDVLIVTFGSNKQPAIELPDPGGRLFWSIASESDDVLGFAVLGAREWGLSELASEIALKKKGIEDYFRKQPHTSAWSRRASRLLIEGLERSVQEKSVPQAENSELVLEFNKLVEDFRRFTFQQP